jgi:uncharacterized protein (DUF1800 family)
MISRPQIASALLLSIATCFWTACGAMSAGTNTNPLMTSVVVTPSTAAVRAGDTLQLSAKVNGTTDQTVTWSVNGMAGGSAATGKISATGLYTAPTALPTSDTVDIEATSTSRPTLSGKASLTLQNPIPTVTSISPSSLGVGNFSITINGKNFVSGSKVMFAGQALTTKFVSSTQLTATGMTTAAQKNTSVQLTVVNPDPGSAASTALLIKVSLVVAVTITPASASPHPGESVQFKATVTGSSDPIQWAVNNLVGGNATVGTISATGLYKAPAAVPNPATVTISVITTAGSSATGSPAHATILSNLPVLKSVLPSPIPVGKFTMSASGSNFLNGAQVIFGGTMLTTTFVSSTTLSATGTSSAAGTVAVEVINPGAGSPTSNTLQVQVGTTSNGVTAGAAARLLEQSTFGPTPSLIQHVQQVGMQAFLNEQYSAAASTYPTPGAQDDISIVKQRFFTNALSGQDQLRQRVAWTLAQIFVVSNQKIGDPSAFTSWMNMLQKDAFGNFATLLNDVTVSPTMGHYLDMVNNDKPDPNSGREPNENYAREILQLFSIGLAELNPDGSPQLDGNGIPVPTYTQDTIIGFAHVFTGWTYPTKPGSQAKFFNPEYYGGPMIPIDSHHDTGTKLLLNGVTLPAGGTTQADLTAALQNIFTHPNIGPFISKQLIQHLVTSNPSPDYVSRITAVFNDNGSGVRGDMKALVNAILMDAEARRGDDATQVQPSDGHLKEPVLFMLNLLRAMNATSDGSNLDNYASDMKEEPFESPTVFNFYPPDNAIPGSTLLGPEFRIFNSTTSIARINFVNNLVYNNVGSNTKTDISTYVGLAPNPGELVDSLASVLLHGQISDNARNTIVSTISNITDNTQRTKTALYLMGSSSQFQVEH